MEWMKDEKNPGDVFVWFGERNQTYLSVRAHGEGARVVLWYPNLNEVLEFSLYQAGHLVANALLQDDPTPPEIVLDWLQENVLERQIPEFAACYAP